MSGQKRRQERRKSRSPGGPPADKGVQHSKGFPVWAATSVLLVALLALWLMAFEGPRSTRKLVGDRLPMGRPYDLMNYRQFKHRYPRYTDRLGSKAELSRRQLLFTASLASLTQQNVAYVLGLSARMAVQSPFKADRTTQEEADIMFQLRQFNLTAIKALEEGAGIDSPVSGPLGPERDTRLLDMANPIQGWLRRKMKKPDFYEVPNYPLDQQPKDSAGITHIDADLRDCAGNIHDQSGCGACYAFSWLSFAGWHYCRQSGDRKVHFSEQHMIDCGNRARLNGCQDGLLTSARAFTHTFGTFMADDYPYKASQSNCRQLEGPVRLRTVDFTRIVVDRAEWERVLEEQPILVEAHLPRDFSRYQRGIHPGDNCFSGMAHGMLLVGHGRQEGHPYWLLKNSMGADWGENGYFRLSREAPMATCFRTGFISKFKFEGLDQAGYDSLYDSIKFKPTEHKLAQ